MRKMHKAIKRKTVTTAFVSVIVCMTAVYASEQAETSSEEAVIIQEEENAVKKREPVETDAIMNGVEAKVSMNGSFDLWDASLQNGWVCLVDGSGKGFGSPWVAVNLDQDLEIWGEEGAEVYVGMNGILRFKLTETESGKEISTWELLASGQEDVQTGLTLYAERYDWEGNLVEERELGSITEKDSQAYYAAFTGPMNSEISAVGAAPYGNSTSLTMQDVGGDAVCYGTNGAELVRYPGADASSMHASISNDGKVLVINRYSSGYSTDIFTVGQTDVAAEGEASESGNVYTDTATIKRVQEALNNAGYDCGTADGISGSRTVNAINAYRAANSLDQNGLIDDEMLNSLGL